MKLLKYLESIKTEDVNVQNLERILTSLRSRISTLEIQEPESSGITYEKWEEKVEELDSIIQLISDHLEELKKLTDDNTTNNTDNSQAILDLKEEILEDLSDEVIGYQIWYGGLSRVDIE